MKSVRKLDIREIENYRLPKSIAQSFKLSKMVGILHSLLYRDSVYQMLLKNGVIFIRYIELNLCELLL